MFAAKKALGARRSVRLPRVAVLALLLMGMSAPTALAGDYHGIVVLDGSSFQGASGNDRVNNIGINYSSDFLNNEIWVFNTGATTWEEAGINKGLGGSGCPTLRYPNFFWADGRPPYGPNNYHCHTNGTQASLNTYYGISIKYNGSANWSLNAGGYTGTSTSAQTSANELQAGMEDTNQSILSCGSMSSLAYIDGNGNPVSGWQDASNGQAVVSPYNSNPPYAAWVNQPTWERSYANESC